MQHKSFGTLWIGATFFALCGWLILAVITPGSQRGEFHALYNHLSFQERIEQAELIVAGTVTDITSTRWNQESGRSWRPEVGPDGKAYAALPLFVVTVSVERPIAGPARQGDAIPLTVVGYSPVDGNEDEAGLHLGDKVVVMASQVDLAWRDGPRTVWQLMSLPADSYLRQGADGLYRLNQAVEGFTLDALAQHIHALRASNR